MSTLHIVSDLPEAPEGENTGDSPLDRLHQLRARRWAYLQIALSACSGKKNQPMLSHAEYRLLVQLVLCANTDLSDSFPSAVRLAEQLHWTPRYLRRTLHVLTRKGWVRRCPRNSFNGGVRSAVNQFCIPANAVAKGSAPWVGP